MSHLMISDLAGILHECIGADESIDDYDSFAGTSFADLGFDSLVLLDAASRVKRDFGVALSDDDIVSATTPGELLGLLHSRMVGVA